MIKKLALVDNEVCVSCGACAKECPLMAISVWRGWHALVDGKKCVGCGKCAKACPAGCITVESVEVTV